MTVPVQVCRLSTGGNFEGLTVDVSMWGARLRSLAEPVRVGEVIEVRYNQRQAPFRVVWVGKLGTVTEGHAGMECLTPEVNLWNLDKPEPDEDEPLWQDIELAGAVQDRLLPQRQPPLRTLDYSGACVQARTVGGDYYDFLDLGPGQVGFVEADVAGKGVGAALLMATLQGNIHSHNGAFGAEDLPRVLASVNQHLYQHSEAERYATMFLGHYDDVTRTLHYVNCGHNSPLLLRQQGTVERLSPTATVLGLFAKWECSVGAARLGHGDVLSVYTDGITEARDAGGEEFGEARLLETLRGSQNLEARTILRNVEQAVEEFRSGDYEDDLTVVIARAQ